VNGFVAIRQPFASSQHLSKENCRRKLVPKSLSSRFLLFSLITLTLSTASFGQIGISVSFGPPALPVYTQPLCPAEGYIWVPGYWAYDPNYGDYYWVPGTWVLAPEVGYLWTPPYWAWENDAFFFHEGYWGPAVGFYGGIDYGFGYFGHGYEGGRWNDGRFFYNRAVNNINVTNITNVYNVNVTRTYNTVNRVSYNGGPGGVYARPTPAEEAAAHERHLPPPAPQIQHVQAAAANQQLRASVNHGRPPIAATPKPTAFKGAGVVPAKEAGAPYRPPAKGAATAANANRPAPPGANEPGRPANETAAHPENRPANGTAARPENRPANGAAEHPAARPRTPVHAADIEPHAPPAPARTDNSEAQRQYQEKQQQMYAQQQQEHEKLAQQQAQDHQRMEQQQASAAQIQQMEREHQQQTMQMEQRHAQQQQQMSRQAPPPSHGEGRPAPPKR
jgi:WXXGXW repeat (2 copies)